MRFSEIFKLPFLGAVANYSYQTLIDVGVDVKPSSAGFYLFPNFEKCREKLEQKGVKTGQDMCDLLFEEKRIAVSSLSLEMVNISRYYLCLFVLADARWAIVSETSNGTFDSTLLHRFQWLVF